MAVDSSNERSYHRASSIAEAADILASEDAIIVSGGQSVLPLLRQGMIETDIIVDISAIDGYDDVVIDADGLAIGGLCTHRALIESSVADSPWRALVETAAAIGDRQVRNWGTVGGAVAHADPSLDYPPTMAVLDASVRVSDGETTESIPIEDLYLGPYMSVLGDADIVVAVHLPRPIEGSGVSFQKFSWRKGDMSLVNAAARVTADDTDSITDARLCIGSVVPRPTRLPDLEAALEGVGLDDAAAQREVAAAVPDYTDPVDEEQASIAYKNRIATNLVEQAIETAAERAREGSP